MGAAATYNGAAATYSGAAATYIMDQVKISLTEPQVELELDRAVVES